MAQPIPMTILNGFLGAGKTTLIRQLLKQAQARELHIGLIVNDMSALEIDGILLNNNEPTSRRSKNLVSIFGVDISSSSGLSKLESAIEKLLGKQKLDHLLLETSGASHPLPLVKFLQTVPQICLKNLWVMIDALMLERDMASGQSLMPRLQTNIQSGKRDIVNLMVEQILFCNKLLLSRCDLLTAQQIQQIASTLHPFNPYIDITATSLGNLPLDAMLKGTDYDYHRVEKLIAELAPEIEQPSASASSLEYRVIEDKRPFHPQRLWDAYHQYLGTGVYRSKGFFWLPTRDDLALVWNQAAGSINLEIVSFWKAGVLTHTDNRLSQEEKEILKARVEKIDPIFGDRHCSLTIIGEAKQIDPFCQTLESCFLTPEEITDWQAGKEFIDPWPTSARYLGNK